MLNTDADFVVTFFRNSTDALNEKSILPPRRSAMNVVLQLMDCSGNLGDFVKIEVCSINRLFTLALRTAFSQEFSCCFQFYAM